MMGIGAEEGKRLTYWEFTARRHVWNKRHEDGSDGEPVEPPDLEYVQMRAAMLEERGIARSIH